MSMPDIRSLLPHSGPMVLLDRVIAADEESLCAEVRIRQNSLFCNADGVGAWVGLEYMAQAIGAYAGYTAKLRDDPIRVGFLLGTRRYQSSQPSFAVGSLLKVYGIGAFMNKIDIRCHKGRMIVVMFEKGHIKNFIFNSKRHKSHFGN